MPAADFDDHKSEDRRRAAHARLDILDAFAIAMERREDLIRIVGAAADADAARRELMAAFGLDEIQAAAALDLQIRRFAREQISRVAAERDELRAQLGLH